MPTRAFGGFVLAVILTLAACSGAATPPPGAASPSAGSPSGGSGASGGSAVTIKGFAFDPATTTVPIGTTIRWTNMDSTNHTVTFDDGSVTSDSLATNATFDRTFSTAGTFTYHCKIHPTMTGTVTVTP